MTDLQAYRPWLLKTASKLSPHNSERMLDLAQEGWIEMWQSLKTFDPARGALPAWLTYRAHKRMLDVAVNSDRWFGRPARYMGRSAVIGVVESSTSDEAWIWEQLQFPDFAESVVLAYHAGQIAEAISRLTPQQRKYVYLRFWCGYQESELKSIFGYAPGGLWYSERNGARKKLRETLAYLAPC